MSNVEITNVDRGSVELSDGVYRPESVNFSGEATYVAGTIMARKLVADAVSVDAAAGNTGAGTVTDVSVVTGPIVPSAGEYTLECTETATNGGTFMLKDPGGNIIATNLVMTDSDGAATTFVAGGLTLTITDAAGGAAFAAGDEFTLTVAADGGAVPYASDGAGGAQSPRLVLTEDLSASEAGDVSAKLLVAGRVNARRLVIHADGDGDNITNVILDRLRDYSIVPENVSQLARQDNQ